MYNHRALVQYLVKTGLISRKHVSLYPILYKNNARACTRMNVTKPAALRAEGGELTAGELIGSGNLTRLSQRLISLIRDARFHSYRT